MIFLYNRVDSPKAANYTARNFEVFLATKKLASGSSYTRQEYLGSTQSTAQQRHRTVRTTMRCSTKNPKEPLVNCI
jgi:hypothetical protein